MSSKEEPKRVKVDVDGKENVEVYYYSSDKPKADHNFAFLDLQVKKQRLKKLDQERQQLTKEIRDIESFIREERRNTSPTGYAYDVRIVDNSTSVRSGLHGNYTILIDVESLTVKEKYTGSYLHRIPFPLIRSCRLNQARKICILDLSRGSTLGSGELYMKSSRAKDLYQSVVTLARGFTEENKKIQA
ncbi:hypothetical protein CHS0354_035154 [Potamilus streckersoni]|uniref:IRS-type PTB domain-containing protein n=1 Tax=Potamilus streckersoni TaxID=2493646 RepID=A0AAE0TFV6_9BIVA|nr:hypothetical protein CHS0354_035154 [Potamilus streckersoni]